MNKYNYITGAELETFGYTRGGADMLDMQIALGLKTCKTVGDVLELLKDVRQHERDILEKGKK